MRRILAVICALLWIAESVGAQNPGTNDSGLFDPPLTVHVQFVPQYFVQLITNDPRYERIEALITNDPQRPWYEVILMDKTTGKRAFYCSSADEASSLNQAGMDAYYAPIEFTALKKTVLSPAYRIRLRDRYGQAITWRFIVNTAVAKGEMGFASPAEYTAVVVMYAQSWAAAATGTAITIGDRTEAANGYSRIGLEGAAPCEGFYAAGLTITEITPGIRLWLANFLPGALKITRPALSA